MDQVLRIDGSAEGGPKITTEHLGEFGGRAGKGVDVTYATSTMGAGHTAGYVATNILMVGGDMAPLSSSVQAELSRNLQIATAALDATGSRATSPARSSSRTASPSMFLPRNGIRSTTSYRPSSSTPGGRGLVAPFSLGIKPGADSSPFL